MEVVVSSGGGGCLKMEYVSHLHVMPLRLHLHLAQGKLRDLRALPLLDPAVAIEHLAFGIDANKGG